MFNIFKSNRMENLMSAFAGHLGNQRSDPMHPEWIGVQSRGMKQWISARLADAYGVCANTHFLFPKQIIEKVFDAFFPLEGDTGRPDDNFLFWSVLKQMTEVMPACGLDRIEHYLEDDDSGRKSVQLARRVAFCFDNYLVYRPDMILDWQHGQIKTDPADPDAAWQSLLWQRIFPGRSDRQISFLADRFLRLPDAVDPEKTGLPSRISFFGISSLPPLFLQVFDKLSQSIDVNLFVLSPSDKYYFDIQSEQQAIKDELAQMGQGRINYTAQDYFEEKLNPLLASFGKSGQDFFSQLEAFNYDEPYPDLYQDPAQVSRTMLSVVQSDIFNLEKRSRETSGFKVDPDDLSVSIHACHSPMRETQVLKDLLIDAFETDPELMPHDIIVMMPDIEAYAQFIESVFSQEPGLPFSVSDRKKRSQSLYLEAFWSILLLKDERLEHQQLLQLLAYPFIRKKFGISTKDLADIEMMVSQANILWGVDAGHRERLGLPGFNENTWQFGLDRLFMAMAMPEDTGQTFFDVFPSESCEGQQLDILGRLARFCYTLFDSLKQLNEKKTITSWVEILLSIHERFMLQTAATSADAAHLFLTLESIRQEAQAVEFNESVSFDMIRSVLQDELDQSVSQGSFLAGRITFCNIMPMRSIPYKIVVLMGMDEAAFPRQVFSFGFDLMKKYPRAGDKNERRDDRYLFLETLLSARDRLMITYTGQNIHDNSEIPCSGVVSELVDVIRDGFIFPENYKFCHYHHLHPFHPSYFGNSEPFFSYSRDNLQIAQSLLHPGTMDEKFAGLPSFKPGRQREELITGRSVDYSDPPSLPGISVEDLVRFFKNPARWLMNSALTISLSQPDQDHQDRESYTLAGLDQYQAGQWLVDRAVSDNPPDDSYSVLKAMGSLPFGQKGKTQFDKLRSMAQPVTEADQRGCKNNLPPFTASINVGPVHIESTMHNLYEDGQQLVSFGALNGARLLEGWIKHLVLNAAAPRGYPQTTRLVGRDPVKKKEALVVLFEALGHDAISYLEQLAELFCQGQERPVHFFVQTAYQFAVRMQKLKFARDPELIQKALNHARPYWEGGWQQQGERDDRYVQWCFSGIDPLSENNCFDKDHFAQVALFVFQPLLIHMKGEK